jgi:hypothetical protein
MKMTARRTDIEIGPIARLAAELESARFKTEQATNMESDCLQFQYESLLAEKDYEIDRWKVEAETWKGIAEDRIRRCENGECHEKKR